MSTVAKYLILLFPWIAAFIISSGYSNTLSQKVVPLQTGAGDNNAVLCDWFVDISSVGKTNFPSTYVIERTL